MKLLEENSYLNWAKVICCSHEILTEDGYPFNMTLPFWWNSGIYRRWHKNGSHQSRIRNQHRAQDRLQSGATIWNKLRQIPLGSYTMNMKYQMLGQMDTADFHQTLQEKESSL